MTREEEIRARWSSANKYGIKTPKDIEYLLKENQRLRGALEFYENRNNYFDELEPIGDGTYGFQSIGPPVFRDMGQIARQALEGESDAK